MNQLQRITQAIPVRQRHPRFRPALAAIAMAAIGLIAPRIVAGQSTTVMPPVYHPSRLQVVKPMVREEGTVLTDPVHQADGDATFEFRVQGTTTKRHVEITCVYPPRFDLDREACAGYHNHVLIPHAGDHVRITGPLVRDLVHDAEFPNLEIHPAITIIELGS
jgi:hypothetical protein